jgi:hypothetical protein
MRCWCDFLGATVLAVAYPPSFGGPQVKTVDHPTVGGTVYEVNGASGKVRVGNGYMWVHFEFSTLQKKEANVGAHQYPCLKR